MQMSTTVKSISLSAQASVIDGVELESERETQKLALQSNIQVLEFQKAKCQYIMV